MSSENISQTEFAELFPYNSPRDSQLDSMITNKMAAEKNGVVAMEGACGTGKTLSALVPYIAHIKKENTDEKRILVATSVRQQMDAFKSEIQNINNNTSEHDVSAVCLVSLASIHPYVNQGVCKEYSDVQALRDGARRLATDETHDYTYEYLSAIAGQQTGDDGDYKYGTDIPEVDGIEYDPYYAQYRSEFGEIDDEEDISDSIPLNTSEGGLYDEDEILRRAASKGLCPHSIMRLAIEHVDVIVGNYNHIFEPMTASRFTAPILDDKTLAIFDEAHNIVPRVRNFLSDSCSFKSIINAKKEANEVSLLLELSQMDDFEVMNILNQSQTPATNGKRDELEKRINTVISSERTVCNSASDIKKALEMNFGTNVSYKSLEEWRYYLDGLTDTLDKHVRESTDDIIALREPTENVEDGLSRWSRFFLDSMQTMELSQLYAENISSVRKQLSDSSTISTNATSVGKLLSNWYDKGHTKYYRTIEMEEREQINTELNNEWQYSNRALLTLNNCIPSDKIASRIDTFSSSILMSATLEPLDIYECTTGLDKLSDERPLYESTYGIAFSEKNRLTICNPAPRFTSSNRERPFNPNGEPNLTNDVREKYQDILLDAISATDGNILIVMPSYKEAEWASKCLRRSFVIDKDDIYLDQSSTAEHTDDLKSNFFNSDNAVLITAARGTLIEGVDYVGDKLSGVIVCGVPIINTNSKYHRAIEAAYDSVFETDISGFELAYTVPAVRKARQAIGRVIRTDSDIGFRMFVDERYCTAKGRYGVGQFLSRTERLESEIIETESVGNRLKAFWKLHES